jgi:nucleoside-diphosphate kinase
MGDLTFGIIKPDAVRAGKTGQIMQRITDGGFKIRAMKLMRMTRREAEGFYAVHRERPFFGELTEFMSSGPCVVMVLEKEEAVKAWRDLMGATDPAKAEDGTLRKEFGASMGENAVHGSDS